MINPILLPDDVSKIVGCVGNSVDPDQNAVSDL